MTWYEKISQMSLDELAEYLCDNSDDCSCCLGREYCVWGHGHANGLKKWLKEDADNDG